MIKRRQFLLVTYLNALITPSTFVFMMKTEMGGQNNTKRSGSTICLWFILFGCVNIKAKRKTFFQMLAQK